jgi:hypothetical protein
MPLVRAPRVVPAAAGALGRAESGMCAANRKIGTECRPTGRRIVRGLRQSPAPRANQPVSTTQRPRTRALRQLLCVQKENVRWHLTT